MVQVWSLEVATTPQLRYIPLNDIQLPHDIPVVFLLLCPAATTTILPVVPDLQTVAVSVLCSILTSLTLVGDIRPRPIFGILLIIHSGLASLPSAEVLCSASDVILVPGLSSRIIMSFGIPFRSNRFGLAQEFMPKLPVPMAATESAILP